MTDPIGPGNASNRPFRPQEWLSCVPLSAHIGVRKLFSVRCYRECRPSHAVSALGAGLRLRPGRRISQNGPLAPWRGPRSASPIAGRRMRTGASGRRAQRSELRLPQISPRWWHVRAMSASHKSHYGFSPTSSVLRRAGVGSHQAADAPQPVLPPYRTGLCGKNGFSAI